MMNFVTLPKLFFSLVLADDLLVTLPNGMVQGREDVTPNNKPFYAFQSVPFAAPPVGNLRFMPPVPPENWEGVFDATQYTSTCYQMNAQSDKETEDCLRLNIYTPQLPNDENVTLLPVMFYIYGGGFILGSSDWAQPHLMIDEDVVVVTINYRVGPFGFLSTQDTVIPGNAGLHDQQFALQWVHDNIALFGGDPAKVTIFGQSAGSASVTYQLLHTESEGLFRGAIGQSGTALNPWAFQRRAREFAFTLAGYIDESFKDSNDSQALLEFLQNATAQEIDDASNLVAQLENDQNFQLSQGFFFAPVIELEHERAFLTERMYGSFKAGNFIKIPILMGFTSEECIAESGDLDGFKNRMASYDENLDWLVPDDMLIEDIDKRKEVGQQIRQIYVGNSTLQENIAAGIRYASDDSFTRAVIMHSELSSQFTDVYFYQFSYEGPLGGSDVTFEGAGTVAHAEDNAYLWYRPDFISYPENDQIAAHRYVKIFTNFAKELNPLPAESELFADLDSWPTVTQGVKGSFLYVDINVNLTINDLPRNDAYRGWNEMYANLGYDDFDTY